ncbi:hypothetical protein ACFQBQ_06835 [Granulicella cerasi]|uniref:Acyl-CoA dehydrogenase n=1 Tax=Granulicella cerasi TaxID=741063 RepID=A0ABW1Z7X8_9BACT|nr:hypothetical protein [Granulicella cerasi]
MEQLRSLPPLPFIGRGQSSTYLLSLAEIARKNLSLARVAEAHFDALSILAEAGRAPVPGALYGVWASEIPGQSVSLSDGKLFGRKRFCTGAGLLNRALVTVTEPEPILLDIDLESSPLKIDTSEWITSAFADTSTGTVTFDGTLVSEHDQIGSANWYLTRPGFWAGALSPAACWAGGALGLVDWALKQKRDDPHTRSHLGAMTAAAWNLRSALAQAGEQVDTHPKDVAANHELALKLRHVIEQCCADILTRIGRAYGPHPLALDANAHRRYAEVELYIRQSHAERDLESLGNLVYRSANA